MYLQMYKKKHTEICSHILEKINFKNVFIKAIQWTGLVLFDRKWVSCGKVMKSTFRRVNRKKTVCKKILTAGGTDELERAI